MIERIQRFIRNEPGERTPTDLNALLRELTILVDGDARLHDVELRLDLGEIEPVSGDAVQIQQVLVNLVRNAIDAMGAIDCQHGKQVVLTTRQTNADHVMVSVTDQGNGISDEDAKHIFEPFHTTKGDGVGLGLAICASIIDAHGGEIGFEPNTDHGVTFYFRLPKGEAT